MEQMKIHVLETYGNLTDVNAELEIYLYFHQPTKMMRRSYHLPNAKGNCGCPQTNVACSS